MGRARERKSRKREGWRTNGLGSQPGTAYSIFIFVQTSQGTTVTSIVRLPRQNRIVMLHHSSLRCVSHKKLSSWSHTFHFAEGSPLGCKMHCNTTRSIHGSGPARDLSFHYRTGCVPGKHRTLNSRRLRTLSCGTPVRRGQDKLMIAPSLMADILPLR